MFKNESVVLERLKSDENVLNIINGDNNKPEESSSDSADSSAQNILDSALKRKKLGRPRGAKERSHEDRAEIALLGSVIGTKSASSLLEVSPGQIHNHNNGKINFYDKNKNSVLEEMLKERKNSIRDLATKQIEKVLSVVDDQAIENLRSNAIKATTVAMNLSRIVEKLEPKEQNINQTANFIIMQPTVAQESEYEVIDV